MWLQYHTWDGECMNGAPPNNCCKATYAKSSIFSLFVWNSVKANIPLLYSDHTFILVVYSICLEVLLMNVSLTIERSRSTDF